MRTCRCEGRRPSYPEGRRPSYPEGRRSRRRLDAPKLSEVDRKVVSALHLRTTLASTLRPPQGPPDDSQWRRRPWQGPSRESSSARCSAWEGSEWLPAGTDAYTQGSHPVKRLAFQSDDVTLPLAGAQDGDAVLSEPSLVWHPLPFGGEDVNTLLPQHGLSHAIGVAAFHCPPFAVSRPVVDVDAAKPVVLLVAASPHSRNLHVELWKIHAGHKVGERLAQQRVVTGPGAHVYVGSEEHIALLSLGHLGTGRRVQDRHRPWSTATPLRAVRALVRRAMALAFLLPCPGVGQLALLSVATGFRGFPRGVQSPREAQELFGRRQASWALLPC
eukprot:scaffold277_cov261-Pinguiococcus_pyrenoidosus.AAC.13